MEIKRAERNDGNWVIRHRIEMFRWMGFSEEDLAATEPLVREYLKGKWGDGIEFFLAVESEEVVGGCAVTFSQILPSHVNPTGRQAYLHNLYVEPEHRHKGFATKLVNFVIDLCLNQGIRKINLHATDMGQRIYDQAGFAKAENYYTAQF
ncbi:MAG: GNAT family N-acetyltransferase [Candidatus Thorarchaeota archaeon]|jgi:GNAT superfamily N-acetyltransferase